MLATQAAPVVPQRVSGTGDIAPDDSAALFALLEQGIVAGLHGALLTLVDSVGGSARAIGAQMAVLEDGRYAGYLSSGCIEAAIATEAIARMPRGKNEVLRFGAGSPFFDIRLPCGGSMDVLVDVGLDPFVVADASACMTARLPFALLFDPGGPARLERPPRRTGWDEAIFRRTYLPPLQLVVLGRGLEFEAVVRLASTAGYPLTAFAADDASARRLRESGIDCSRMGTPRTPPLLELDAHTALLLLFHDHEWELEILDRALPVDCAYIGALGSARAHEQRCEKLLARGHSLARIEHIRGPIGLFGPTRDASSLAISVLAELAQVNAARLK